MTEANILSNSGMDNILFNSYGLLSTMMYLTIFIFSLVVVYLLIFTFYDYRLSKRKRSRMPRRNLNFLIFFGSILLISVMFIKPSIDQEQQQIAASMEAKDKAFNSLEITDEDYLFLVHALMINDKSVIGKEQVAAISKALKDNAILVDEFLAIPNVEMEISEEVIEKHKLGVVTVNQAKAVLIQMVKAHEMSLKN